MYFGARSQGYFSSVFSQLPSHRCRWAQTWPLPLGAKSRFKDTQRSKGLGHRGWARTSSWPLKSGVGSELNKGAVSKGAGKPQRRVQKLGAVTVGSSPFSGLKREETCALGRNTASRGTPRSPPALQSPVSHWPNAEKCSPCGSVSPGQGAGSGRMTRSGGTNGD